MNNQIKLINCFIKFLPTKIIDDTKYYILRDDELRINEEILNVCIDNNQALVKFFKLKNWSSVRGGKKRVLNTILQILKNIDIDTIRQVIFKEGNNNGRRFQSTQGIYIFKWDDEKLNEGEFHEYITTKKCNKEYYKEYYIKNKEHISMVQRDYRDRRYNDVIIDLD